MSEGKSNPPDPSQLPPPAGWVPPEASPYPPPPGQSFPPPGQGVGQPWQGYGSYPPPPPQPPPTNGFAIAALVLSLIGGVVLSIIFGLIALRQIKRKGQRGRGQAIAALVISGLWIVVVAVVAFAIERAERDESGAITSGGELSVEDLEVGDCLNNLEEDEIVMTVDAVSCSAPHDAEVYADIVVPDGQWPGTEEMTAQANQRCAEDLAEGFPAVYEDRTVEIFFFHPTSASWREGDRGITCVAEFTEGPRTGSLTD